MKPQTFNQLLKQRPKEKWALYIGLNMSGVDDLAVQGGEDPANLHVTLLYGYFQPKGSKEDAENIVEQSIESIEDLIPEDIKFDAMGRFEASESSDGKDVIFARVKAGQLEEAHEALQQALEKHGLKVEKTFPEYNPHMTLKYIEPGQDYPLEPIDKTGSIKEIIISVSPKEDINKTENPQTFNILKADDEKRLVFGWANVAFTADGQQIVDLQEDIIDTEDLEEAVYKYVLEFRDGGEEHIPTMRKKASLVESVMFTKEKMKAMGIPEGIVPEGWWIGFYVKDDAAWELVKNGTYQMFSIEGTAIREKVEDDVTKAAYDEWLENNLDKFESGEDERNFANWKSEYGRARDATDVDYIGTIYDLYRKNGKADSKTDRVAKTFAEVISKFNPWHDSLGRFTSGGSSAAFMTIRTKDPKKQHWADMAVAREKLKDSGGAAPAKPNAKPQETKPKAEKKPTVAGVERGEPMTREQANEGRVNPNFNQGGGYRINCQSCVVAFEARLRGYDVKTLPNTRGSKLSELARNTRLAWKDPKTGKHPDFMQDESVSTPKKCRTWLENTIKSGERYTFQHLWKGRSRSGHIISLDRDTDGSLRLYDPQNGKTYKGADIDDYLSQIKYKTTVMGMKLSTAPKVLRVDNLEFNPDFTDHIMEAS